MKPGQFYRIIFRIPGVHNKPREAVFKFLAETATEYDFNARPLAGTTTIEKKFVLEMYESQGPVMLPRIYRGEVRVL